jgi:hypothetical protein
MLLRNRLILFTLVLIVAAMLAIPIAANTAQTTATGAITAVHDVGLNVNLNIQLTDGRVIGIKNVDIDRADGSLVVNLLDATTINLTAAFVVAKLAPNGKANLTQANQAKAVSPTATNVSIKLPDGRTILINDVTLTPDIGGVISINLTNITTLTIGKTSVAQVDLITTLNARTNENAAGIAQN